jgi:hypothetical protein
MSRPFQHGRFYADDEDNTLSSNHYIFVIPAQHNFDFSKMVPNDALHNIQRARKYLPSGME